MIENETKKETNQATICLDIKNPSSIGVIEHKKRTKLKCQTLDAVGQKGVGQVSCASFLARGQPRVFICDARP